MSASAMRAVLVLTLTSSCFHQVWCAPTGSATPPGGAHQEVTYSANYTNEGGAKPCATISGTQTVQQNCGDDVSLQEAVQNCMKTLCNVISCAAQGPPNKKVDLCVSSNLCHIPKDFIKEGDCSECEVPKSEDDCGDCQVATSENADEEVDAEDQEYEPTPKPDEESE